jgi:hypothetical protein
MEYGMTRITTAKLALRGSPLSGDNPQPLFREPGPAAAAGEGFPPDKLPTLGAETDRRILPYTAQDRYGRKLRDMDLDTVVMENDYLRAEFLPGYGGRLWGLYDRKGRRDIVYRNPVFRPANLAIRDAWFSGGIEWNIGRYGHTVHTCSPVFAGIPGGGQGAPPVLRLWEFERQTRLFWRIDFSLSDRAPILYAYVRIENPDAEEKPLYWWTNTAVPQTEKVRILSAADEVLYFVPGTGAKTLGGGTLPRLSPAPGLDSSYPALLDYAAEYFFQCDSSRREDAGKLYPYPWEAAVYEDGYAFAEASTAPLLYRKMFAWGCGPGGRRWQEFLSLPGGGEYLEVQAGLAPSQLHTGLIAPYGTVDFVQAFTGLSLDPASVSREDYRAACAHGEERVAAEIGPSVLEAALERGRSRAGAEVAKILAQGSGWGALECRARPAPMPSAKKGCGYPPPGLSFPPESIGPGEKPWLDLINQGALPPWPVSAAPPGFPGAGNADIWQPLLLLSPQRGSPDGGDWLTPYYLGVIDFERGDTEKAKEWWGQSLSVRENPWALRNLAQAEQREGNTAGALDYYRRIFSGFGPDSGIETPPGASLDVSFLEEFVPLLLDAGLEDEAFLVLESRAKSRDALLDGPLVSAYARLAFARRDDALLDRIFSREPPHIREGSNVLSDLWIEREQRRLREGEKLSPEDAEKRIREALKAGEITIPRAIDFRMYTGG